MNKKSGIELLLSDERGVYIPQDFAQEVNLAKFQGIEAEDIAIILAGPDHEAYWDAWDAILSDATHTDKEGHVWYLHQDGDLWVYCVELMTQEERHGLFHADGDCDCADTDSDDDDDDRLYS